MISTVGPSRESDVCKRKNCGCNRCEYFNGSSFPLSLPYQPLLLLCYLRLNWNNASLTGYSAFAVLLRPCLSGWRETFLSASNASLEFDGPLLPSCWCWSFKSCHIQNLTIRSIAKNQRRGHARSSVPLGSKRRRVPFLSLLPSSSLMSLCRVASRLADESSLRDADLSVPFNIWRSLLLQRTPKMIVNSAEPKARGQAEQPDHRCF